MATPAHEIPVRKPDLGLDADLPLDALGGSALATHVWNGLNLVFPDGERFFIRAVRDHLDAVEDPELRAQVRAFFGQEGRHAAEHEHYFEVLGAQGYRLRRFLGRFGRFMKWSNRWVPARLRLAMTAGAEHYTATFGALALDDPLILEETHPAVRRLIVWHATEEIEHKAVAFDVLQAAHPGYLLRITGYAIATAALFGWTIAGTRMLLQQDRWSGRIDRARLRRERRALLTRDDGATRRRLLRAVLAYLRPGFHPSQTDELALAHRRLAEVGLGGAAGEAA